MAQALVSGSLSIFFLYDVADEIRLDKLRAILGAARSEREPAFRQPAPGYVQFREAPVAEPLTGLAVPGGEQLTGRVAYYDYGVASIRLELPFEGGWETVVALSSKWMNAAGLEQRAQSALREHLKRAAPALVNPYPEHLSEDYYIIYLRSVTDESGRPLTACELIERHAEPVAQIVRGEAARFSAAERAEILEARLSYYESDLLVVGWTAALVYDTPEGAGPTIQLLEYANSQLLEFRHYDAVLTRLLSGVYRALDEGTGPLARWRMAREAERLNTIRLDVRELTERVDNSIKFLSDMFASRLYRMAAARIGVPDYRTLVEQKLQSAGELYGFMMDRFYHGRAFVLELMVVVILVIELAFFFRDLKW